MGKKLHMIGNAHIDPVWLWRWTEGFHEVKATFRSALDRMKEDPAFRFTASSSIFYEWVEYNTPAMFEEIKARVTEGRWEIAGGWVIEPDCNIPCGESFVRQGLYGQRYFIEKFGKAAKTGFNPDSFGHNGSLPQILAKSGLKNYVFLRPGTHEKDLPARIFRWQAADGSEVLCYRIPYSYNTWADALERHAKQLHAELADENELMLFYGVGNHGGGPTKENIRSIHTMNEANGGVEYAFSGVDAFFNAVRQNGRAYPLVTEDLQHHASGCYSVHSGIKQWNRRAENALLAAEKYSVIAKTVLQRPYPTDYERAWKNVLFNQFHDILAGTSLISGYEDARNTYGEAVSIADRNMNDALQAIIWDIDMPQEPDLLTKPLVVFNPHPWGGVMSVETEMQYLVDDNFKVLDEEGNPVRAQRVQAESVTTQGRLLITADMPPMGYRTFRVFLNQDAPHALAPVPVAAHSLENDRIRLAFDPENGYLKSLYDKTNGREMLAGKGARLAVIADDSDTWAHDVFRFDKELGDMALVYIRVVECGPVRSAVRARYRWNDSYVTQEFRLYRDLEGVEVKVTVDWREPQAMLKIKFAANLQNGTPTYEIPYGHIERPANGDEECGQMWVDLSGAHGSDGTLAGLAMANDAKYSFSFTENEMHMTVLRNAIFAHHVPAVPNPDLEYERVDHGVQRFTYQLLPHKDKWKESPIIRAAQTLNQPAQALFATYHKGALPQKGSFLSIDNPQISISAVKQAEDGSGVIIRAYETLHQPGQCTINASCLNRTIQAAFAPSEIKTFLLPYDMAKAVAEVSMTEYLHN